MINRFRHSLGPGSLRSSRRVLRLWALCVVLSACAFEDSSGGCGGDSIVNNYRFDRWCGDHLCGWETVTGTIRPAPTWHEHELGVELVDNPTVIGQTRDTAEVDCISFELIADIDVSATVVLALDYNLDGTDDVTQQLPVARWEPIRFLLPTPLYYAGIRYELRKLGDGRALVAELRAESSTGCVGNRPPSVNVPNGGSCDDAAQCLTGLCSTTVTNLHEQWLCEDDPANCVSAIEAWREVARCSTCGSDVDCANGEVCGFDQAGIGSYRACQGPALLGDPCLSDAQCTQGFCRIAPLASAFKLFGVLLPPVCSVCRDDQDCDAGKVCGVAEDAAAACVDRGARDLGDICIVDGECASGLCCGNACADCCDDVDHLVTCDGSQQCVDGTCQ